MGRDWFYDPLVDVRRELVIAASPDEVWSVVAAPERQAEWFPGMVSSVVEETGEGTFRTIETAAPWGQGFPEPEFDDEFEVLEQRIVGGRHLKLLLQPRLGEAVEAISFNQGGLLENRRVRCAYRIEVNRYRGWEKPQLVVSLIL